MKWYNKYMSKLRSAAPTVNKRSTLLVTLKMGLKSSAPLDESHAWSALQAAFKDHEEIEIIQAQIGPDKDGVISSEK